MDYLKTVVPSQLFAERGANLVVINPGSANVRIGFGHQNMPFNVPHCIARHIRTDNGEQKRILKDKALNSPITEQQSIDREKAYDISASLLKIPFFDEDADRGSLPPKMGRVEGYVSQKSRSDSTFTWTDVVENDAKASSIAETLIEKEIEADIATNHSERTSEDCKYKKVIYGEDALKIHPSEPYCISHPIRRGRFNISHDYPLQQVCQDIIAIWDWILTEKLHIKLADRSMFSAILVLPETFDFREIRELLSIVFRDLKFSSAVVHQEGLAAAFGNGLPTACIVNIGAQVTTVVCVEDGVALPSATLVLPYGGEDISRCLLWVQQRHQSWPSVSTDPLSEPFDMLMLNKIKESYCQIREGEFDAIAIVHSFEMDRPIGTHKTRLSALNVPLMGLFYPKLLVPEEYPPPPQPWFSDCEDMLEDTSQGDYNRRSDMPDAFYASSGLGMWGDSYPIFPMKHRKFESIGLAQAISSSILSTGRIELQRRLFCSIQLIGGSASPVGLIAAVEDRVLNAIPSNEAIDTVEVLQSRTEPSFVCWKGGAILGILDLSREAWIHREDWLHNGVHVGSGRKYNDSYFLQSQVMCYYNT